MLENLNSPSATQGGDNAAAETISRKDLDLAWLAGIVDGEGCISAYWWKQTNPACPDNHSMRVSLQLSNTNAAMIRRVTEICTTHDISFGLTANKSRGRGVIERPCVTVVIMGKGRLLKLLPLLVPHLTAKRRQAELALELIAYRESLAVVGRESKGRFAGMSLRDDERINSLIQQLKDAKWEDDDILSFSRRPSTVFGESSTTLRSPSAGELAA
jgi:hypothetical protein